MPPLEAAAAWIHSEAWQRVEPGMISEDLVPRSDEVYPRLFARGAVIVQRTRTISVSDHAHNSFNIARKPRFNVLRLGDPRPNVSMGITSLGVSQTPADVIL
jgi:hypothetical protein